MTAIYKTPGEKPEVIDIPNTLEALQDKVGGHIECLPISTDACLICNEEGLLLGLPYNGVFLGRPIVGPVLVVGVQGEEFTDIPQDMRRLFGGCYRV